MRNIHRRFEYLLNWFSLDLFSKKQSGGASTDGLKVATKISEICFMLHVRSDTKSIVQGGVGVK